MHKIKILIAALSGVIVASSASAVTTKQPCAPGADGVRRIAPVKVVSPTGLPRAYAGSIVKVEFTLNDSGQPQNIRLPRVADRMLERQLREALSQWTFAGSVADASAMGTRFILPLKLNPET